MFLQYIVLLRPLAPLYWWQQNKIHKLATRRKCRFATGIALHFLKFKLVRLLRTRSVVSAQCLACLLACGWPICYFVRQGNAGTGPPCFTTSSVYLHSQLCQSTKNKNKYEKIQNTKNALFYPPPNFSLYLHLQAHWIFNVKFDANISGPNLSVSHLCSQIHLTTHSSEYQKWERKAVKKPAAKSLVKAVVLQREAVVNTQLSFQRSVKTFDVN